MNKLFSINFWVTTFTSTLITMIMIFLIKKIATGWNIPVISTIAEEV